MRGEPDEIPQNQGYGGGIMSVGWDEYLTASDTCAKYCECHRRCKSSFEGHRRNILHAVEATKPKVVACLGAGVLNDIPYESIIRSGASIHLVDWIPDSIDTGIDLSIIQNDESGQPHCIYCHPTVTCPQSFYPTCIRITGATWTRCGPAVGRQVVPRRSRCGVPAARGRRWAPRRRSRDSGKPTTA